MPGCLVVFGVNEVKQEVAEEKKRAGKFSEGSRFATPLGNLTLISGCNLKLTAGVNETLEH